MTAVLCFPMFRCSSPCSALCFTMFRRASQCSVVLHNVSRCSAMFGDVPLRFTITMCRYASQCAAMLHNNMFRYVSQCAAMLHNVPLCFTLCFTMFRFGLCRRPRRSRSTTTPLRRLQTSTRDSMRCKASCVPPRAAVN